MFNKNQVRYKTTDFKHYTPCRWISFFILPIFAIWIAMFFAHDYNLSGYYNNIWLTLWMDWWGYFTIQSNVLVFIYLIWYWFNPTYKRLHGNFLIYVMTYITVTAGLYSGLLLQGNIEDAKEIANVGKLIVFWLTTVIQHMIVPFLMLIFYITYLFTTKEMFNHKRFEGYWICVLLGMIYPLIYVFYAALLPWMSNHHFSVYGQFTNLDGNCIIDGEAGKTYNLIYFAGAIALFFALLNIYRLFLFSKNTKK